MKNTDHIKGITLTELIHTPHGEEWKLSALLRLPVYYTIQLCFCQVFFLFFLKKIVSSAIFSLYKKELHILRNMLWIICDWKDITSSPARYNG